MKSDYDWIKPSVPLLSFMISNAGNAIGWVCGGVRIYHQ